MSRKRDTNWARDEITVLLDGITDITSKRAQDGKRTNSREIFEYAAKKLGEKGHSARAEREKCRAKWKKMKEEYTHAKKAREGNTNYKEAPGIVPFFDRMEMLINGPFDNISPHSTIVRRTNSISNSSSASNTSSVSTNNAKTTTPTTSTTPTPSNLTLENSNQNNNNADSSNLVVSMFTSAGRHSSGLRASARIAANTTSTPSSDSTTSSTPNNHITNMITTNGLTNISNETSDSLPKNDSTRTSNPIIHNNNNRNETDHNNTTNIATSSSSSNLIVLNNIQRSTSTTCAPTQLVNNNNNENPTHQSQILGINNIIRPPSSSSSSNSTASANNHQNQHHERQHQPQQPNLTNPSGSDFCATYSNTNQTTNICPNRPKEADVSYRVSGGCRQITIFGDQDIDIKFRGDCVTINKIELDYSGSDGS